MPSINYNGLGKPALELPVAEMLRGQPGLALDFSNQRRALSTIPGTEYLGPVAGLPGLSFVRASAASYIDAAGQIQFAASGQPRFDHDATTLAPLGFLAEAARANALVNPTWSGPIIPTSWNSYDPAGVSIVPSKFGPAVSARRFTAESSRPRLHQAVTLSAGVTYTFSIEVESVSGGIATGHAVNTLTPGTTVTFPVCPANPAGGTSGAVGAGKLVYTVVSATTQAVSIQMGAGIMHNLVGMVIDFSMPQLEAGGWPTSFIPGGARAGERLSTALPDGLDTEGFTLAIRGRGPRDYSPSGNMLVAFSQGGSFTNRFQIYGLNGSVVLQPNPTAYPTTGLNVGAVRSQDFRLVLDWTPGRPWRASLNGGAILELAGTPLASGLDTWDFGGLNTLQWGGSIAAQALWRGAPFSETELRGLLV
ncbi:phage head spike fiber domain-containing protein [Ancylobacter rudongensis]|uniref:Uncharacterized protein n=1 Tax=Ancylobacter rudongensis TaxID=177413 RepID=A0A1G4UQ80_9HYPH|nr:hypothetical protein [Ancylobacter rudongensis]SCW95707.1 hypothetical protein SAMN05660859_0097 [Ancylobacter rudongensis]